ncbi:alpha/beta fold hydrolase [Dactylosporangium matsuzakiense]|uniref:Alpha/beta hydrolase n=1 Tax=Dactylosporangium matsuzakiense TaxID=53360 RepID=A0A9W6KHN2_9ACTN|nr:alpha/beta hydrolase [Dactylosporangium matsuzakiense]UWZ41132.1 alpha/beta hydrolase [Dactylosporangium matsuzakiense]GLL00960.1 alpha/beta hydrolase [Dactylosporangium matsuzakiense]
MATFVLIHGAGGSAWDWHLLVPQLRARGHDAVAADLPADPSSDLHDYADAVVHAAGERSGVIVVAHSFGAFTAPLVTDRLRASALVYLSGMVPAPGERPADWWKHVGHEGWADDDPFVVFYNDVPRPLAEEGLRRSRPHPSEVANDQVWPLAALPAVPTRFVLCTLDNCLPAALLRRVVPERLGVVPDEFAAGHCAALSRPAALADLLHGYA